MHRLGITETNFDALWLLVIIANLSTLLPLPFLNWLPDAKTAMNEEATLDDITPAKHTGQQFLPDLMSELVPQSLRQKPVEELDNR